MPSSSQYGFMPRTRKMKQKRVSVKIEFPDEAILGQTHSFALGVTVKTKCARKRAFRRAKCYRDIAKRLSPSTRMA